MPLDHAGLHFSRNTDADAVETFYAGVLYETRRQAQWAAFLDALGIEHLYRPRTFYLDRNLAFTPDLWVPALNAWLVVKATDPDIRRSDRWKIEVFSRQHPEFRVWVSSGAPRPGEWHLEQMGETPVARGMLLVDASEARARVWVCGANDELAQRLVFDAIEVGSGRSDVRPRSFPADPNADSVMRMAYAQVEHFEGESWKSIGSAVRQRSYAGPRMAGGYPVA